MSDARQAINAAVEADASRFAPESLGDARRFLEEAEQQIQQQVLRSRADERRAGEEPRVAGVALEPGRGRNPTGVDATLSSSRQAIRCVVAGRVQGVYYRAATVERAGRLALRGWVRNLAGRPRRSRRGGLRRSAHRVRVVAVARAARRARRQRSSRGVDGRRAGGVRGAALTRYARNHFVRSRSMTLSA